MLLILAVSAAAVFAALWLRASHSPSAEPNVLIIDLTGGAGAKCLDNMPTPVAVRDTTGRLVGSIDSHGIPLPVFLPRAGRYRVSLPYCGGGCSGNVITSGYAVVEIFGDARKCFVHQDY